MTRRAILAAAFALVAMASPAADDALDAATASALRASILHDAGRVRFHAIERREAERAHRDAEPAAEAMAALASVSATPPPTLSEFRADMDGFRSHGTRLQMDRLIRRIEPRQRFLEASADRRYERFRRVYNSIVGPFASVLSGQFLDLIVLPAEGIEQAFVGGKYATPEERRELSTAQRAVETPDELGRITRRAESRVESLTPRRERLAALQARRNGERELREGRVDTADWWFRREMALTNAKEPISSRHRTTIAALASRARQRDIANSVVDGESRVTEPDEYFGFADLLRAFVATPAGPDVARMALATRSEFPDSSLAPTLDATIAAVARGVGDWPRAEASLADASRDGAWSARANALLDETRFGGHSSLNRGAAEDRAAFWRFVVSAEPPRREESSLDGESARLAEAQWIRAIRSVFVVDMLSRLIATPFLEPFPADRYLDSVGSADARFLASEEGREWLARAAKKLDARKRPIEAAAMWRRADEPLRAAKSEARAARAMEKKGMREEDPARRAAELRRLANAFPQSDAARRTAPELERAERESRGFLRISREAVRAYPAILSDENLSLPESLADGSLSNGEMDKDGVLLLRGGGILYRDAASKGVVELARTAEQTRHAAEASWPMLRRALARDEALKPMARRRIPIALEGGAMPGFDAAPGLVPLSPDPALRRLYE